MGNAAITRLRIARYNEQRGRCLYCRNLMWERAIEPKRAALFRVWPWRPGEIVEVNRFLTEQLCTAEHVQRVADGGSDDPTNVVAVCRRCNSSRQDKPSAELFDRGADIAARDDRFAIRIRVRVDYEKMRRWCFDHLQYEYFVRRETALYGAEQSELAVHEECMILLRGASSDEVLIRSQWAAEIFD